MRFKIRNALIGAGLYLYLFALAVGLGVGVAVVLAIYVMACMLLAKTLISSAESRRSGNVVEFSQSGAADAIGTQYGSFHHVYHSSENVNESLRTALGNSLKGRLGCSDFREIGFKDVDRDLEQPETRVFAMASAPETARKSGSILLCAFARVANVQSVRWWILVSGLRDPNKVFWRYAFSPFTIPFVVWPYVKRQYDPLNGLMTIYPGFFNGVDVLNRTREIQYVAFETLVEVLESYGIDTTDLKNQRGNILNVNVSGGQASFGAVVQGAMNRVTGNAGAGVPRS